MLRLHHRSWHRLGSSRGETKGEMGIQDSTVLVSGRCGPFSWLQPVYRSGLKKTSFVTPSAVPTQCIKEDFSP